MHMRHWQRWWELSITLAINSKSRKIIIWYNHVLNSPLHGYTTYPLPEHNRRRLCESSRGPQVYRSFEKERSQWDQRSTRLIGPDPAASGRGRTTCTAQAQSWEVRPGARSGLGRRFWASRIRSGSSRVALRHVQAVVERAGGVQGFNFPRWRSCGSINSLAPSV